MLSLGLAETWALVGQLRHVASTVLADDDLRALDRLGERLSEARLNVVVLGEFNRGKTALVNALLGAELLPVGVLPVTSVVTVLRHGAAERLFVRFEAGEVERPLAELSGFISQDGNPDNLRGVEAAIVRDAVGAARQPDPDRRHARDRVASATGHRDHAPSPAPGRRCDRRAERRANRSRSRSSSSSPRSPSASRCF